MPVLPHPGTHPRRDPALLQGYVFLRVGWWRLVRPSSSHLTTASSSLARSTVPISPVGFPKFPKPSTRSPGSSSWLVARVSPSGGFLARSESGIAPGCDRGGWGALRSLGISFLAPWIISLPLPRGQWIALRTIVHRLDRYSIALARMVLPIQIAQF